MFEISKIVDIIVVSHSGNSISGALLSLEDVFKIRHSQSGQIGDEHLPGHRLMNEPRASSLTMSGLSRHALLAATIGWYPDAFMCKRKTWLG